MSRETLFTACAVTGTLLSGFRCSVRRFCLFFYVTARTTSPCDIIRPQDETPDDTLPGQSAAPAVAHRSPCSGVTGLPRKQALVFRRSISRARHCCRARGNVSDCLVCIACSGARNEDPGFTCPWEGRKLPDKKKKKTECIRLG